MNKCSFCGKTPVKIRVGCPYGEPDYFCNKKCMYKKHEESKKKHEAFSCFPPVWIKSGKRL